MRRTRFERPDLAIEISLVLSYMGQMYVAAVSSLRMSLDPSARTEIGRDTAHTATSSHAPWIYRAQNLRKALGGHAPATRNWALPAAIYVFPDRPGLAQSRVRCLVGRSL